MADSRSKDLPTCSALEWLEGVSRDARGEAASFQPGRRSKILCEAADIIDAAISAQSVCQTPASDTGNLALLYAMSLREVLLRNEAWYLSDKWNTVAPELIALLQEIDNGLDARPVADGGVDWRLIDTAPTDRTQIIISVPSLHEGQPPIVGEAYFNSEADGGTWWWAGTEWGDYYASPIHETNALPTHWQPLPIPPASATAQSTEGE